MRYAVIDGGLVVNVILADPGFTLAGVQLVELGARETVAPGWRYVNEQFENAAGTVQPPQPVPTQPVGDVFMQIEALQSWAAQIQAQVDAATEILMGGLQ